MRYIIKQWQRGDVYLSICGPSHRRFKGPGSIVVSTLDDEISIEITADDLRQWAYDMEDASKLYKPESSVEAKVRRGKF